MKTMKKLQSLFLILALGTFTATTSSCKKDDPAPTPKTITDIVSTDANFSILKAAVVKAGLASNLSTGTLTVFAPDNAAFTASGITEATINSLSKTAVDSILKYHVLASKVNSSGVPASDAVTTLLGTKLFASKNTNGVFVNGIKIKKADVAASNGVIHVISKVLIPPTKTIAQLATETPSLSLLLAAVKRADLVGAVSAPGKLTVFAPTNDAFIAADLIDEATINQVPQNVVAGIVSGHVLGTNVFASDLKEGLEASTLQTGVSLIVSLNPAASVKIKGSTKTASKITTADIVATNGVVHLIDRVILP